MYHTSYWVWWIKYDPYSIQNPVGEKNCYASKHKSNSEFRQEVCTRRRAITRDNLWYQKDHHKAWHSIHLFNKHLLFPSSYALSSSPLKPQTPVPLLLRSGWQISLHYLTAGCLIFLWGSCMGNIMDRWAWRAIVCGVTKNWTLLEWLNNNNTHMPFFSLLICLACMLNCFSRVRLFATLWIIAHQALLSMGFSW